MDLKTFDTKTKANAGAFMHLRNMEGELCYHDDENGEAKPVGIWLLGEDSDTYQSLNAKVADTRIKETVNRGKRVPLRTAKLQEDAMELLARCTAGWDGFEEDGQPLKCDYTTARRVYTEYPAVREQAEAFINDRSNFLGN